MKLLIDQNISYRLIKKFKEYFEDIQSVKQNNLEDAADITIWQYALQHGFTLVTFDEDFYNIQLLKGVPPKIIWFKTGNLDKGPFTDFLILQKESITAFVKSDEHTHEGCLELFLM
jgi:predicted nuclease of predicted toxin-antitoxin system